MNNFIKAVLLASLIIVGLASVAKAEERIVPKPFTTMISSGILCMSERSVQIVLTRIALSNRELPQDCFQLQKSFYVGINSLYWYETSKFHALIIRVVADGGQIAYGWSTIDPKEEAPVVKGDPV